MKISYVTNEFLDSLKKQVKTLKIFAIILSVLFATSMTLSIVFANYQNRILMSVIGSIVSSIILILDLAIILKLVYINNFSVRYSYILEKEGKKFSGKLAAISKTITLNNNDQVKELSLIINDSIRKFYIFDLGLTDLVLNKKYKFVVVEDYIKEISYEA